MAYMARLVNKYVYANANNKNNLANAFEIIMDFNTILSCVQFLKQYINFIEYALHLFTFMVYIWQVCFNV